MIRRPPRSTLLPYRTLFRSIAVSSTQTSGTRRLTGSISPALGLSVEMGRAQVRSPVPLIYIVCYRLLFNDTATTEIYALALQDALPIYCRFEYANLRNATFDRSDLTGSWFVA